MVPILTYPQGVAGKPRTTPGQPPDKLWTAKLVESREWRDADEKTCSFK